MDYFGIIGKMGLVKSSFSFLKNPCPLQARVIHSMSLFIGFFCSSNVYKSLGLVGLLQDGTKKIIAL